MLTIAEFIENYLANDTDYEVEHYDTGGHCDFILKEDIEYYPYEVLQEELKGVKVENNKLILYWNL